MCRSLAAPNVVPEEGRLVLRPRGRRHVCILPCILQVMPKNIQLCLRGRGKDNLLGRPCERRRCHLSDTPLHSSCAL